MSPKSATARLPNRDTALKSLYEDIATKKMFPFWATSADVEHDEIRQLMGTQRAVPHLWNYKSDIEPILYRAADLIKMDDSERRSLILINPGLAPKRAEQQVRGHDQPGYGASANPLGARLRRARYRCRRPARSRRPSGAGRRPHS